jgi:hypothetical protein
MLRRGFEVVFGRGGSERLVACWTFVQSSDLESLRIWIADDDGVVVTAVMGTLG